LNTFSVKCRLVEHLSMNMCVKLLNTSNKKLNGYRRVRRPISLVCSRGRLKSTFHFRPYTKMPTKMKFYLRPKTKRK